MTSAFSFDGAATIERTVPWVTTCKSADIVLDYEIEACAVWISGGRYQKVALQFPDELLADAASVASTLGKCTGAQVFVLADTSYGSCCVDEVTAEHGRADCLIHYGAACLTPATGRLPVKYVFQRLPVDPSHCGSRLRDVVGDADRPLVLLYDTEFCHACDALVEALGQHFRTVVKSALMLQPAAVASGSSRRVTLLSRCFELPGPTSEEAAAAAPAAAVSSEGGSEWLSRCSLAVVTRAEDGGPLLTGVLLRLGSVVAGVYSYCPATGFCQREAGGSCGSGCGRLPLNRRLARRYHMIEKAKDARIVGIVAGTLGVDGYLDAIGRLRELLRKAGKKSYTFVVGKLSPAKLANFLEVDVFVLVACPQNSLLDSSEFYAPIVTAYEMEIACNPARPWDACRYTIDYRSLLPGGDDHVALPEHIRESADVSLVTGAMRRVGIGESSEDRCCGGGCDADGAHEEDGSASYAVAQRPAAGDLAIGGSAGALAVKIAAFTAGEFLLRRSWQGLEQRLGQTAVAKATPGQRGIAASYEQEPGADGVDDKAT